MNTVAAFASTGAPEQLPVAQNLPTQPFMTASNPEPDYYNEKYCQQLTGLTVRETSVSVGRYLNVYWHSILEVDSLLRAALLPIRECTPKRLQHCMTVLVRRYPDPRGNLRWVNRLMGKLVPMLDWKVVLAYARFADPAIAEQSLTPAPGTFGS